MTYISQKTLTKEDFLSQCRDNPRYELADGELIDMEPTGPHETVSGKLATQVGIYCHINKFAEINQIMFGNVKILKLFLRNHL